MTTEHVDSAKTYAAVWIALLLMTALTTSVAYIDLGRFSVVVALTIAVCKMLLVALFFMHVRHSTKLTKLVVLGGLLWLGRQLFALRQLRAHGGGVGAVGRKLQVVLELLHGGTEFSAVGQNHSQNLPELRNAVRRIVLQPFAGALFGGLHVFQVEIGRAIVQVRQRIAVGSDLQ